MGVDLEIEMINKIQVIKREDYFVVEKDKNEKRRQSSRGEGVEGLEEENKLEVLGNLLKLWTNRRDRDELGDVEEE